MKKISTFLLKAFILILFCVITFFITRYLYIPKGQKIEKTDSAIGKTIGYQVKPYVLILPTLVNLQQQNTHILMLNILIVLELSAILRFH